MGFTKSKILALLLLVAIPVSAGSDKILLSSFVTSGRVEMNIKTCNMLPDSAMIDFGSRALIKTSKEAGGIESAFWITMVAGQMLYEIPDTVTQITQASIISKDKIADIRSFVAQYFNAEKDIKPFDASGSNKDDRPVLYSIWNDTLQLYPIPVNADSIYFKCYVEHPVCDSLTDTVFLKSGHQEAAKAYMIHLAYRRLQEYEVAEYYLKDYDRQKAELIAGNQIRIERGMTTE